MAFTLTLLGTDTTFTPDSGEGYEKAETLSYISTLINPIDTTPSPVSDGASSPVAKKKTLVNSDVVVIEGPTTAGTEVGDRIARGVAAVLEAISRGEKDISIIAHSRGAVEAILVAHELERIQNQLVANPSDSFKPEFCNSVCPYTKFAMNNNAPSHKATFEGLDWTKVSANINNVKLSMLNIDPVPGGNFVGISRISHAVFKSLAWRDPRFYVVPKIVKEYKQFVYENERTRCFKPIVPKCASPDTVFKLTSLPGHHGTGSGNLLDQQRGEKGANPHDPNRDKTQHVQELVVVELIDFLTRNGVSIKPRSGVSDPFAELISDLNSGLVPKEVRYKRIYLNLYNQIMANKEAYQHYNNTSYRHLGQEQALQRLIWTIVDQRIVHYQAHNDTFLETIVPSVPGGNFLNYEHARMFLNNELGLDEGAKLNDTINNTVTRLLDISSHAQALNAPPESALGVFVPTASAVGDKFAYSLGNGNKIEDLLFEGVGTLIEQVRQTYVQKKLASHEQQPVYEAVRNAFRQFEQFTTVNPENKIAKKIFDAFKSNVENTLDLKHKALKDHYRDLANRMQEGKVFKDLHNNVQQIISDLIAKQPKADGETKPGDDEAMLLDCLIAFAAAILKHDPQEEDTQQFLFENSLVLSQLVLVSPLAKDSQQAVALLMIQAAEDAPLLEETNLMVRGRNRIHEVIAAHNDLEQFKKALPGFKELNSTINNTEREASLDEYKYRLAFVAAQYIAEHNIPVNSVEDLFGVANQELYKQIKNLAIAFGAVNPLTLDIQQKVRVIVWLHERHELLVKMMAANDTEKSLIIKALKIEQEAQAEQIRALTTTGSEQAIQIQALTEKAELLTQAKERLAGKEKRLTGEIEKLTTKETQQTVTITDLNLQLVTLDKERASLVETREELTREKERLTTNDGVQTKKIEELNARISGLDVDKALLTERGDKLARTIEELRTTIVEQKEQISDLNRQVDTLSDEKNSLTSQILALNSEIDELTKEVKKQAENIAALNLQVDTQAEEKVNLLAQLAEQTKKINVLDGLVQSLTKAQESSVANEKTLTSKIAGLIVTAEAQTKETASLKAKIEIQTKEIKSLTEKAEKLTSEKQVLATKISEQAKAIEKLTSDRVEQAKLIQSLTSDSGERARMIEALTSDQAQQAQLIKGMELNEEQQQKIIEQLTTKQLEKDALIEELQGEKQGLAAQLTLLKNKLAQKREEQKGFIDPNNKFERSCLDIVERKLMPLTKDYLLHLAKEIRRNVDPELNITDFSNLAKNVNAITWPEDKSSQLLKQKFEELSALNDILHSKSDPSEKVENFYQSLSKAEQTLAEHRDPWLQRFFAGAAKVLAIVLSGFLLAPKLGSTIVQSSGQAFFKEAKKIENDKPEPESDLKPVA